MYQSCPIHFHIILYHEHASCFFRFCKCTSKQPPACPSLKIEGTLDRSESPALAILCAQRALDLFGTTCTQHVQEAVRLKGTPRNAASALTLTRGLEVVTLESPVKEFTPEGQVLFWTRQVGCSATSLFPVPSARTVIAGLPCFTAIDSPKMDLVSLTVSERFGCRNDHALTLDGSTHGAHQSMRRCVNLLSFQGKFTLCSMLFLRQGTGTEPELELFYEEGQPYYDFTNLSPHSVNGSGTLRGAPFPGVQGLLHFHGRSCTSFMCCCSSSTLTLKLQGMQ